jgi:hypothetical protein
VNELFKNKIIAIILAVLTFLLGSVLFIYVIFYISGYPLTSIPQHQLYAFFGILVSAVLASMVYGSGRKERAENLTKYLNESLELEIKEDYIKEVLSIVERAPPFLINVYVSKDMNAVESFESQIEKYKSQLTDEDRLIIRRIIEMPIPELQNLLNDIYMKTNLEQFKILADSKSEPFLTLNVRELKKVLFNE